MLRTKPWTRDRAANFHHPTAGRSRRPGLRTLDRRPEHLARWWGPRDDEGRYFTVPHFAFDARPGGRWRICMRAPNGTDYWHQGVFREVEPPRRLVLTHCFEEEGGLGEETIITVTFEAVGGRHGHGVPPEASSRRRSSGRGPRRGLERVLRQARSTAAMLDAGSQPGSKAPPRAWIGLGVIALPCVLYCDGSDGAESRGAAPDRRPRAERRRSCSGSSTSTAS